LSGEKVWEAGRKGVFDRKLLLDALARMKEHPLPKGKQIEELVKSPVLFVIEYKDGLRACVLTLDYAVLEWAAAWKYADNGESESTLFWTQELRPFQHFSHLIRHIGRHIQTGQAPWPVERTLLTTGMLDALLQSKHQDGRKLDTPWLLVEYQSEWNWRQPPPPPPGRPITEQ
jgi:hypothetical protein